MMNLNLTEKEAFELKNKFESTLNDVSEKSEVLEGLIRVFEQMQAYKFFKDEEGNEFYSFQEFLETPPPFGIGKTKEEIYEIAEHRFLSERERVSYAAKNTNPEDKISVGRRWDVSQKNLEERALENRVSKRTQLKLDTLAERFPHEFSLVQAGVKTPNKALIDVGMEEELIQFPINNIKKFAGKIKDYLDPEKIKELCKYLNDPKHIKLSEFKKIMENRR